MSPTTPRKSRAGTGGMISARMSAVMANDSVFAGTCRNSVNKRLVNQQVPMISAQEKVSTVGS